MNKLSNTYTVGVSLILLVYLAIGMLYAVNDNFRVGVHFQQPYIDFYWEFFEF